MTAGGHRSNDRSQWRSLLASSAAVTLVALMALSLWQAVTLLFDLPKALLPTPKQVWLAAVKERDTLWRGTLMTGLAAIVGLVAAIVIGSMISVAFSLSRKVRLAFFPYVVFLQTVPIVAIAPLLIIWSGYRFRTVVIVTVIVCLFPIVNNVTAGLLSVNRDLADLFRLYGSGSTKKLLRLQIPTAIPFLMLGAKTSSGLAVIGAIIAEFFVGSASGYDGLGALMTAWQAMVRTDALIASLFASTLLGLLLFGTVQLISVTLLRRWTAE